MVMMMMMMMMTSGSAFQFYTPNDVTIYILSTVQIYDQSFCCVFAYALATVILCPYNSHEHKLNLRDWTVDSGHLVGPLPETFPTIYMCIQVSFIWLIICFVQTVVMHSQSDAD